MKTASYSTLHRNKKTRRNYAYRAIERASMNCEVDQEYADAEMRKFLKGQMSVSEEYGWACTEKEYRDLND